MNTPVYNDYISNQIKNALVKGMDENDIVHDAMGPYMDLDEDAGFLLSLKHTIKVMDKH